jgi:hypothetical protein
LRFISYGNKKHSSSASVFALIALTCGPPAILLLLWTLTLYLRVRSSTKIEKGRSSCSWERQIGERWMNTLVILAE